MIAGYEILHSRAPVMPYCQRCFPVKSQWGKSGTTNWMMMQPRRQMMSQREMKTTANMRRGEGVPLLPFTLRFSFTSFLTDLAGVRQGEDHAG